MASSSKYNFRLSLILLNLLTFVLLSEALPAPEDTSITPEAEEGPVEVTNPTSSDPNDDDGDDSNDGTEEDFGHHHHGGYCRGVGFSCWNHYQCCTRRCIRGYYGRGVCEYGGWYYKK